MLATVYRGPRHVEVRADLPLPRVVDGRDAVVRVTRSAICGTDLHAYRGELADFAADTVLGHEFVGVVVEAGAGAAHPVGRRVVGSDVVACGRCPACVRGWHYQCADVSLFGYSTIVGPPVPGAQAEYVRVPFADVVLAEVPHDVSDDQALFTGDVMATAYQAARAASFAPGDTVVVVGAGALGTMSGLCARLMGAGAVVVADGNPARREAVAAQGLVAATPDELADVVDGVSRGRGAGAVIEAVGSDRALASALGVAGPRSVVVAVGAHHATACPFPTGLAFARELTVRFVVGDPILVRDDLFSLIRSGRLDPTVVISHRLPLAEVVRGYELFDQQEAVKVVLDLA